MTLKGVWKGAHQGPLPLFQTSIRGPTQSVPIVDVDAMSLLPERPTNDWVEGRVFTVCCAYGPDGTCNQLWSHHLPKDAQGQKAAIHALLAGVTPLYLQKVHKDLDERGNACSSLLRGSREEYVLPSKFYVVHEAPTEKRERIAHALVQDQRASKEETRETPQSPPLRSPSPEDSPESASSGSS